ncbi:MAG: site-specific integrase, partial [Ktedonobacterales bacterium]
MLLTDAYTEFLLAHDYQPATTRYYQQRLGHLMRWLAAQEPPVTTIEGLSTTLIRRYLDERKTQPSARTG